MPQSPSYEAAMRAPVTHTREITPDSVADNYASMCPGYMEDFYAKLRRNAEKVVNIASARGEVDEKPEEVVVEDSRERVRASGLG